ncbi:MAG: cupin domain-containing protein [Ignavibacteriae bacterium]|nr:cupin domain-containing protein [Ignavibacteriota bacterium]
MPLKIKTDNFFNSINLKSNKEKFTELIKGRSFTAEKIVSNGFKSPDNKWMSEVNDEWVMLLKGSAKLEFEFEVGDVINLKAGDYLLIPAKTKHRVIYTSKKPFCYWLAIHFK